MGLLLDRWAETTFRAPVLVAVNMALLGFVLLLAPTVARGRAKVAEVSTRDALLIGLAQAAAIVPGVSRSGATISAALFLGHGRAEAARFSFLMATPITLGAALVKVPKLLAAGGGRPGPLLGHGHRGRDRVPRHQAAPGPACGRATTAPSSTTAGPSRCWWRSWPWCDMPAWFRVARMRPVLTAEAMRQADRRTIADVGLPGSLLMENAGAAVARLIQERFPQVQRPLVVCGTGNNGGDGFVTARHLLARQPEVLLLGTPRRREGRRRPPPAGLRGERRPGGGGGRREGLRPDPGAGLPAVAGGGRRVRHRAARPARRGSFAVAIEQMAAWALAGAPVVAVDLPSGLMADVGASDPPCAPRHHHRHLRRAEARPPAAPGLRPGGRAGGGRHRHPGPGAGRAASRSSSCWRAKTCCRCFPPRPPGGHKGTFGHLLVIAGSTGKTGAALLAALGALRAGVGLVTVGTPAAALPTVAGGRPEIMTEPLADGLGGVLSAQALKRALALARERDAVVLGPGLGQDAGTREFVRTFVPQCPVPLVVDADALNALTAAGTSTGPLELIKRPQPTIVTPHPGEMARIASLDTVVVQKRRLETARDFANASGAVVVLKGQRTVVAEKGGRAARQPHRQPRHGHRGLRGRAGGGHRRASLPARRLDRGHRGRVPARPRGRPRGSRPGDESGLLAGDIAEALPRSRALPREAPHRRAGDDERGRDRGDRRSPGRGLPRGRGRAAPRRARRGQDGLRAGPGPRPRGRPEQEVSSPTFVLLTSYPGAASPCTTPTSIGCAGTATSAELGLEDLPGPAGRPGGGVGRAAHGLALAGGLRGADRAPGR